jgi:hypothetical protein
MVAVTVRRRYRLLAGVAHDPGERGILRRLGLGERRRGDEDREQGGCDERLRSAFMASSLRNGDATRLVRVGRCRGRKSKRCARSSGVFERLEPRKFYRKCRGKDRDARVPAGAIIACGGSGS